MWIGAWQVGFGFPPSAAEAFYIHYIYSNLSWKQGLSHSHFESQYTSHKPEIGLECQVQIVFLISQLCTALLAATWSCEMPHVWELFTTSITSYRSPKPLSTPRLCFCVQTEMMISAVPRSTASSVTATPSSTSTSPSSNSSPSIPSFPGNRTSVAS